MALRCASGKGSNMDAGGRQLRIVAVPKIKPGDGGIRHDYHLCSQCGRGIWNGLGIRLQEGSGKLFVPK